MLVWVEIRADCNTIFGAWTPTGDAAQTEANRDADSQQLHILKLDSLTSLGLGA